MNDESIFGQIDRLVAEEHRLKQGHVGHPADADELQRLREIEVELDQCWDLLRQRRARRSAGQDPDDAAPRPGPVVEGYLQ